MSVCYIIYLVIQTQDAHAPFPGNFESLALPYSPNSNQSSRRRPKEGRQKYWLFQ